MGAGMIYHDDLPNPDEVDIDPEWVLTDRCPEAVRPALPHVYVAAAQEDYKRARAAMTLLRYLGCNITHDWTREVEEHADAPATPVELARYACLDREGVTAAEVVLVLSPNTKDKGCGVWAELGIAVAQAKRVVITGPLRDRCIFGAFATKYETDLEGVLALVER